MLLLEALKNRVEEEKNWWELLEDGGGDFYFLSYVVYYNVDTLFTRLSLGGFAACEREWNVGINLKPRP